MVDPVNESTAISSELPAAAAAEDAATAPQMTPTLLARLFVVPAILVSILVVGLVTVVVLFGWSSVGQRPSTKDLIAAIQADPGDRQAGVLFPQSKEVWLAAKELAERLKQPEREFKPEEMATISHQLGDIVRPLFAASPLSDGQRLKAAFLLTALGRLQTESAVETLTLGVASQHPALRQAALRGLADAHENPATRRNVPIVVAALDDPAEEVRLVACVVLPQLADAGDATVVAALSGQLDRDREMQWNAALGLARLGSTRGKLVLLSMLDRAYWQNNKVNYATPDGRKVERPFTPTEVEHYLSATMQASAGLADKDLREAIARLRNDPSVMVRDQAERALSDASKGGDKNRG